MEETREEKITEENVHEWLPLLNEMRQFTRRALSMLAPRELDGKPECGVTELGFKLILLGFFATKPDTMYRVVSEYVVDGGRIDLLIEHLHTHAVLALELKYQRMGFCNSVRYYPNDHKMQLTAWKSENARICALPRVAFLEVKMRDYYQSVKRVRTVAVIVNEAIEQVKSYALKLKEGEIGRLKPECKVSWAVMLALGGRVLVSVREEVVVVVKKQ